MLLVTCHVELMVYRRGSRCYEDKSEQAGTTARDHAKRQQD